MNELIIQMNYNPIIKIQQSKFWTKGNYRRMVYKGFRILFNFFQNLGIHIYPNHYYSPIPDTRSLNDDLFTTLSKLVGIDINEKEQLELLSIFKSKYSSEYNSFPRFKTDDPYRFYLKNGHFMSGDAEILYCMVRHFKPKKIIEIGSGFSTLCFIQAIKKNMEESKHYNCNLISIEPYPRRFLKDSDLDFLKLIPKKLQSVPLSLFKELHENDILFIDSSHILKIGGDVKYEYLEIIPRLNKGVLIHIHDILLPAEYPRQAALKMIRFWSEQYLLQAFLIYNRGYKIVWMGKLMHLKHRNLLEKAFPSLILEREEFEKVLSEFYKKRTHSIPDSYPSSFWMKKII